MKRCCVFFFYDADGIVDNFLTYFLDDLTKYLEDMVIVCNGKLSDAGRSAFEKYTSHILVRENTGLDVGAYKAGMAFFGWDRLREFDEVILANSTMMGPVDSFADMFAAMDARQELDYWGITLNHGSEFDPFACNPYGYLPVHIQSHFLAFRSRLLKSADLEKFWNDLPDTCDYRQSVGLYETYFTKRFEDLGYRWGAYCDTRDLVDYTDYPLMTSPVRMLRDYHCPIFKRRSFFHPYDMSLQNTLGNAASDLMDYLKTETDYPIDYIWDNILRTMHTEDYYYNLHLDYVLPTAYRTGAVGSGRKIALVMHLYFMDMLEESLRMASYMPPEADIFITVGSEEKAAQIRQKFAVLPNSVRVIVVENRGRDVAGLLVGAAPWIRDYDYVCFTHDKKTIQDKPGTLGEGFAHVCYDNMLYNSTFVANVLDLFEKNPRLGLLCPPAPNHGHYFITIDGRGWGPNFENTKALAEELGIHVPMSAEKRLFAPYGSVFWFRPKALRPLLDKGWKHTDFPPEPLGPDGTISHAIERVYSFVAQGCGYYTGQLMSDRFAQTHICNMECYTYGLVPLVTRYVDCSSYYETMLRFKTTRVRRPKDWKWWKTLKSWVRNTFGNEFYGRAVKLRNKLRDLI